MERQLLRGMDEDAVPLMRRLEELQRAPIERCTFWTSYSSCIFSPRVKKGSPSRRICASSVSQTSVRWEGR